MDHRDAVWMLLFEPQGFIHGRDDSDCQSILPRHQELLHRNCPATMEIVCLQQRLPIQLNCAKCVHPAQLQQYFLAVAQLLHFGRGAIKL